MPGASLDAPDSAILFALKRVVAKLVRLAITFGVTYPIFEDLLKRSYVEVSSKEFRLQGKEQTDSRITLLTGLNRRDVRQIRATIHNDEPFIRSLERRVADRWTQPPFIDSEGHRAPLPRLASVGGEVSFEALVQEVSTDIRASVLLEQWLTQGFARIDGQDRVVFLSEYFSGRGSKAADMAMNLAHSVSDMIAGYTDLMTNVEPRRLRVNITYCNNLSYESMEELFVSASKRIVSSDAMNRHGEELVAADRGRPDARQRFTFCTYMYRTDMDQDPSVLQT
jgi:Family of unknown function (DUF6502)